MDRGNIFKVFLWVNHLLTVVAYDGEVVEIACTRHVTFVECRGRQDADKQDVGQARC